MESDCLSTKQLVVKLSWNPLLKENNVQLQHSKEFPTAKKESNISSTRSVLAHLHQD